MQVKLLRTFAAGAAVAFSLATVAPSAANAQLGFGVQGSFASDDVGMGVGGFLTFGLGSLTTNTGISAKVGFDYFFPDHDLKYWEINGDALYSIGNMQGSIRPYVGAGVTYGNASAGGAAGDACSAANVDCSSSDIGLNLLGGINIGSSKLAPFVQAKFEAGGGELFIISGGIKF